MNYLSTDIPESTLKPIRAAVDKHIRNIIDAVHAGTEPPKVDRVIRIVAAKMLKHCDYYCDDVDDAVASGIEQGAFTMADVKGEGR